MAATCTLDFEHLKHSNLQFSAIIIQESWLYQNDDVTLFKRDDYTAMYIYITSKNFIYPRWTGEFDIFT